MTAPTYIRTTPTVGTTPLATTGELTTTGEHEAACPACPHPLPQHDPIGVRYCLATTAGAMERGCVCRAR
jgi:hypothetical protein